MAINQTQTRWPILSTPVIFGGYLLSEATERQPGAASRPEDRKQAGFFSQLFFESGPGAPRKGCLPGPLDSK